MSDYKALDWFLIRSPFLSHEEGAQLLESSKSVLSSLEDPFITEIISTAAPSLFAQLKATPKAQKIDDNLVMALFNVISRMTYRSVPFACYASVTWADFQSANKDDMLILDNKEECLRSFELKEERSSFSKDVTCNPTLIFENGIVKYIKEIAGAHKKHAQYFTTRMPNELIKEIKNDPNNLSPKLKDHLLGMQVLWPKINKKKDSQKSFEVRALSESVKLNELKTIESHIIELYRPSKETNISSSTADSLLAGAEILISFFNTQENPLEQMLGHFYKKYESQEISILELLNPESTFSLKFLQKITEMSFSPKKSEQEIEGLLMEFITSHEVLRTGILSLKKSKVEALSKIKTPTFSKKLQTDSFSIISEIVYINDSEKHFHLKYLNGPHAIGHFARYLNLSPALKNKAQSLVNEEKTLHENVIFAEILHRADEMKLNSVMPVTNLYDAVIPVSLQNKNKNKMEIALSDLYVSIQEGKFRLKSKKLNKEVMPVLTNLYNFQKDSNPILQFLAYIEMQNGLLSLGWDWGSLIRMPFLPRVEFQQVILSPARWRISARSMDHFLKLTTPLSEIKNFLKTYNLPDIFDLIEDSNLKLRFDQNNELSMKSLRKTLLKNKYKDAFFQEVFTSDFVKGSEGHFSHDLIIPYIKKAREEHKALANIPEVKKSKRSFPPGSDWTYFNIYLPMSQVDTFLVKHLSPYLAKQDTQWFFIQYNDPEFHIRLRVKGKVLNSLLIFSQSLVKLGMCSHYNILTYDREIERYGGLKGCKTFEQLSQHDSEAAILIAEISLISKIPKLQIWAFAALFSTKMYLQSFGCDQEESLTFLESKEENSKLKDGAIKSFFNTFKNYELSNLENVPEEYHLISAVYKKRFLAQKKTINGLMKLFKQEQPYVSKKDYFKSLVHLSLVRLNSDFDREYEFHILKAIKELTLVEAKNNE